MSYSSHVSSFSIAILCLGLIGCATTKPVAYAGLASSSQLHASKTDKSGRVPYEYSTHEVDWRKYSSVVIDPVSIYNGLDSQFEKVSEADKRELARYMHEQFQEKLAARYRVVSEPGAQVLRVKLTLTGVKPTTPVAATFVDVAAGPCNIVQSIRGKEGLFKGSVSYAVEVYDSATSRLLSAYVQKQYPTAMNVVANFGSLGAAKTGICKGSEDLLTRLN